MEYYEISKEFGFEAGHHLLGLPDSHKCSRPHGHSYRVVVVLRAKGLDEVGFVRDYGDLADLKLFLDNNLDHRNLNDVVISPDGGCTNTTAEQLARWLYYVIQGKFNWGTHLVEVRVSETQKTWASYYNDFYLTRRQHE